MKLFVKAERARRPDSARKPNNPLIEDDKPEIEAINHSSNPIVIIKFQQGRNWRRKDSTAYAGTVHLTLAEVQTIVAESCRKRMQVIGIDTAAIQEVQELLDAASKRLKGFLAQPCPPRKAKRG